LIYEVPGKNLTFDIREDYFTDMIVVDETFRENVYEVHGWHFNDADSVVVDIGANIGSFAIQAAGLGAKKVFAVEPEPNNLLALQNNIKINSLDSTIEILSVGVSDFEGTARITDAGGNSTISDDGASAIQVTTLDRMFKDHGISNVSVLKIDVEGSEPQIILGASKDTINSCKYITIEFDIRSGTMLGDMVMKLSETHHVRTMGSWERGGMIFANRY
jgi:FkbM family methyltransferase